MDMKELNKPGVEEWLHWADVVADRLTDCIHIFKKPPANAAFMPDAERQQKSHQAIALLHRIHPLIDQSQNPTDSAHAPETDLHAHDEQIIDGIAMLFRETLELLPSLSTDMQHLLKSPWAGKFPHKTAQTLFMGDGDESQGIGSGHPEHGRLPEALANMLEREQMGDSRKKRDVNPENAGPQRHDPAPRRKYGTAGRME